MLISKINVKKVSPVHWFLTAPSTFTTKNGHLPTYKHRMSNKYKFVVVTTLQMVSCSQSSQSLVYRLKTGSEDWWKHSGEKLTYFPFILNIKFKAIPATIQVEESSFIH